LLPAHFIVIVHRLAVVVLPISLIVINEIIFRIIFVLDNYIMTRHNTGMFRGNVAKFPVSVAVLVQGKTAAVAHAVFQLPGAEWASVHAVFPVADWQSSWKSPYEEATPQAAVTRVLVVFVCLNNVRMLLLPLLVLLYRLPRW
jgi:hypothetical protein